MDPSSGHGVQRDRGYPGAQGGGTAVPGVGPELAKSNAIGVPSKQPEQRSPLVFGNPFGTQKRSAETDHLTGEFVLEKASLFKAISYVEVEDMFAGISDHIRPCRVDSPYTGPPMRTTGFEKVHP